MKRAVVPVSLAVGLTAGAQEWQFELSSPVLSPAERSTTVTLSIDHGPADYAFAAANLSVSATEPGWSDLVALIRHPLGWSPVQHPGVISGSDVTGITVAQLSAFGWAPTPGRIEAWRATFTVTDFTARSIDVSTETSRFEVYINPRPDTTRAARTPIEGRGVIQVVPAPAGPALLGRGGAVLAGRRRRAATPLCGRIPR
jgi:hypothetical protein